MSSQSLPDKKSVAVEEKPDSSPAVAEHLIGEKQILILIPDFKRGSFWYKENKGANGMGMPTFPSTIFKALWVHGFFFYKHIPLSNE